MNKTFINYQENDDELKSKVTKSSITPRPIAWISTLNENNTINLAPFSFFTAISDDKVIVSFTNKDNDEKDTLYNLKREKEAVINIASIDQRTDVINSAKNLKRNESELNLTNLTTHTSKLIKTLGINEALINLEVILDQVINIDDKTTLTILKIIGASINNDIFDQDNNYIIQSKFNVLARGVGEDFVEVKNIVTD